MCEIELEQVRRIKHSQQNHFEIPSITVLQLYFGIYHFILPCCRRDLLPFQYPVHYCFTILCWNLPLHSSILSTFFT